jgi:hypothetical protein
MSDDPFTTYERMETCRRVEVTLDNLDALAKHFGGMAVYHVTETGPWPTRKPRLAIPSDGGLADESGYKYAEVGSWIDDRGSRWNPEPLTQGWHPEGTYRTTEEPR